MGAALHKVLAGLRERVWKLCRACVEVEERGNGRGSEGDDSTSKFGSSALTSQVCRRNILQASRSTLFNTSSSHTVPPCFAPGA